MGCGGITEASCYSEYRGFSVNLQKILNYGEKNYNSN